MRAYSQSEDKSNFFKKLLSDIKGENKIKKTLKDFINAKLKNKKAKYGNTSS